MAVLRSPSACDRVPIAKPFSALTPVNALLPNATEFTPLAFEKAPNAVPPALALAVLPNAVEPPSPDASPEAVALRPKAVSFWKAALALRPTAMAAAPPAIAPVPTAIESWPLASVAVAPPPIANDWAPETPARVDALPMRMAPLAGPPRVPAPRPKLPELTFTVLSNVVGPCIETRVPDSVAPVALMTNEFWPPGPLPNHSPDDALPAHTPPPVVALSEAR